MAPRKSSPAQTSAACQFWQKSFDTGCRLLKVDNGKRLPPAGAAHYAADFADRAVEEFRRRWGDQ